MADVDPLRRAVAEGEAAGEAGRPVTRCPYPPGTQRTLYIRGYVAGRAQLRRRRDANP